MEIRQLTRLDAEALWKLRLQALDTDPEAYAESATEHRQMTVETLAERLGREGSDEFVYGAFDWSTLVGMAGFYREKGSKRRHRGWVWGVFVLPEHRRRGIGRALVTSLIECARALPGLTAIFLNVRTTRQAARRLYASLGFRSIGVDPQALSVADHTIAEEHMILNLKFL